MMMNIVPVNVHVSIQDVEEVVVYYGVVVLMYVGVVVDLRVIEQN
jgi:hypothetical protein